MSWVDVLVAASDEDAARVKERDIVAEDTQVILVTDTRRLDGIRVASVTVTMSAMRMAESLNVLRVLARSWLLGNRGAGPFRFEVIW